MAETAKGGSWIVDRSTGRLIPKSQYVRQMVEDATARRSGLACPMIISDSLDDLKSMADGRIYTSKRAYYDSVKAHGCEIVANEDLTKHTAPTYDAKQHEADIAADVSRAIAEVSR